MLCANFLLIARILFLLLKVILQFLRKEAADTWGNVQLMPRFEGNLFLMLVLLIYISQVLAQASTHHQLWQLCLDQMPPKDFLQGGKRLDKNVQIPIDWPPWRWWKPAWLQWHASSKCCAHIGAGDQEGSGDPGIWKQFRKVRSCSLASLQYGTVARGWSTTWPCWMCPRTVSLGSCCHG